MFENFIISMLYAALVVLHFFAAIVIPEQSGAFFGLGVALTILGAVRVAVNELN